MHSSMAEIMLFQTMLNFKSLRVTHRLILKMEAKFEGITGEQVISKIVARTTVPTQRKMNL